MKIAILLSAFFITSNSYAAYVCQISENTTGAWVPTTQFEFSTIGGQVGIKPVGLTGSVELKAQEILNSVSTLELFDINSGARVGGVLAPTGKPLALIYPELRIYCVSK